MAPKMSVKPRPGKPTMAQLRKLTSTTPAAHTLRRQLVQGSKPQQPTARVRALQFQAALLSPIQAQALVEQLTAALDTIAVLDCKRLKNFFSVVRAKQRTPLNHIVLARHLMVIFSALPSADNLLEGSVLENFTSNLDEDLPLADLKLFADAIEHLRMDRIKYGRQALTTFKKNMELPAYESVRLEAYLYVLMNEFANNTLYLPKT